MSSVERVSIPLLTQLIPDGIKVGTILIVEFDPDSQWFAVATTMIAQCLKQNQHILFATFARPLDKVKGDLSMQGVDVSAAIGSGRLLVDDWFSASLAPNGRLEGAVLEPMDGWVRIRSLKIADLRGMVKMDYERRAHALCLGVTLKLAGGFGSRSRLIFRASQV